FDAPDSKPAEGRETPPSDGLPQAHETPRAGRVPREVIEDLPALDPAVRAPLYQRILLWFVPNLTAFLASFCIMAVELVASRVIARHLGSSLYTWTSVIGIVLLGITLGNLLGGRLADWFRPAAVLAVLFLLASGACVAIPMLNDWVSEWAG